MRKELQEAAQAAWDLKSKVGRASTPPVPSRELPIQTHRLPAEYLNEYPILLVGAKDELGVMETPIVEAHPNSVDSILDNVGLFQALVVNGATLGTPWHGADTGSARFKTDLVYELCSSFRASGIPVYLIQPGSWTTPFLRWQSLASATFPGFENEAEETGNPQTELWVALMQIGSEKE